MKWTCIKCRLCGVRSYRLLCMMIGKTGVEVPLNYGQTNLCTAHDSFWATSSHCICMVPPNSGKFLRTFSSAKLGFHSATSFWLRLQPRWPRNGKSTCSPCNASVLLDGQLATLDLGTKKTCQNGRHWDLLTKQVVVLYL